MKKNEHRILVFIVILLLGLSNISFASSSYRSDAMNSGTFTDNPLIRFSELSWMCDLNTTHLSSPISNGDLIFITGYEPISFQMHVSGAFVSDGFVNAAPAVFEDEVLCFGDLSGKLYCIDIKSGLEMWCYESGSPIVSAPSYSDGVIYIGNRDGHLLAIDMASGVLRWQYNANDRIESTPYIHDDLVYFGCGDGRIYALKRSDGSVVWDYSTGINITSTPVISSEILYFVSKESLYGLDPQTGSEALRFSLDRWSMSSPVVAQDSIVSYGDYGHYLLAYNSKSKRGFWRFNSPASGVLGAVIGQGKAFFGDDEGNLYAVDVETGSLLWEQILPEGIESVPEYRNGIVYVTLPSGYLFSLRATDGSYVSGRFLEREIFGSPVCSSQNVFVGMGISTTQNPSSSSNFFSDLSRGSSSDIINSVLATGISFIMST
ncbi:PQQ-binding-like beta-propeller repeat protein, partial [bacterium]|nr:PQQ-binding-like beta-propeller repeat protein [bacterium]